MSAATAKLYRWQELAAEPLKGTITRKLITSERMMVAQVHFKTGDEVPQHSHDNEQITYILEGALHFWLGAHGERSRGAARDTGAACPRCVWLDPRRAAVSMRGQTGSSHSHAFAVSGSIVVHVA